MTTMRERERERSLCDPFGMHPRQVPEDPTDGSGFWMYEYKVRRCARGRAAHEWTLCSHAHPGERAQRRDPRRFRYSSAACPAFRRSGRCGGGDACGLAHGVFESWLHPDRYRTRPCKDGTACRRRVCFFAHSPDQLRAAGSAAASPPPPVRLSVEEMMALMKEMRLGSAAAAAVGFGGGDGWTEEELVGPDVGWVAELVK